MERGPLLPSIQAVNSGTEMSYKVQYAPVYTGRAKSRPLSAYEEEILKRALRSRDDDDGDDRAIIVPAEVTSAADVEVGSAKLNPHKLLSKRQLQAQPVMIGSGNSMGSISSTNSSATMTGGGNSAARGRQRESARYNGDYERASAFNGVSLIENVADDFNENDLRSLKRSSSNKQKLRKMEAGGAPLLQHLPSTVPMQQVAATAAVEAAPLPLREALKPPVTLKEQAAELRRYQRRIIYMLNRVMTEAEARQFDQFIELKGLRAKEHRLA